MLPVVFGAVAVVGLASMLRSGRSSLGLESFGSHLDGVEGFTSLGTDGSWDVYRYDGPAGSFMVAMYPGPTGEYPRPTTSNIEYEYPDGIPARTVRACGPDRQKWSCVDLSGRRVYDLFVYHPAFHPGDFPGVDPSSVSYGAVSATLGGRGPGAGGGVVSALGGRQARIPYSWSSVTDSGFEQFRRDSQEQDPQAEWSDALETWVDGETGRVWDQESMGWVEPPEGYGVSILGLNIPLSKEERLERLEEKIDGGKEKLQELEKAAHEEWADLDKIARQIASISTQIEKWEDKRDKVEMRMGGVFGAAVDADDDLDLEDDDLDDDLVDDDDAFGLDDLDDEE